MMSNKVELEFKSFHSPDTDNIFTWVPLSLEDTCIWLEFEIGVKLKNESFLFGVTVATKEGLEFVNDKFPTAVLEPVILIKSYNWEEIYKLLVIKLNNCCCATWECSLQKLQKEFAFEFG